MQRRNVMNKCFEGKSSSHSLASVLNDQLVKTRNQNLKNIFSAYEGNNHRLEFVKSINGIDFINDSQAEAAIATWYALERMNKRVTWIMNISDLDAITEELLDVVNEKVERIIIQGVYKSEIIDFFSGIGKSVSFAMNLEDAVRIAFYACQQGEAILFSPAEPASKTYTSYAERGDQFKQAIAQL